MRKAQTSEILGFLLLVVFVVSALLGLKLMKAGEKSTTTEIATSAHNQEYFKSGANAFTIVTEPTTGKTLTELIGIASFVEERDLEFGPPDDTHTVDVFMEAEKQLDAIYGEGNWHLDIYHAPRYQMYLIILIDTSVSMAEEIKDIRDNIDDIIKSVETTTDKRVAYKLYFLPGGSTYRESFSEVEKNNPSLWTETFGDFSGATYPNEAWAIGMRRLIEEKSGEWSYASARVGIILSDEPPDGCENCGCYFYNNDDTEACCPTESDCQMEDASACSEKDTNINNLIDTANDPAINMKIYTLKADPCVLPQKYDNSDYCSFSSKIPYSCSGKDMLDNYMMELSGNTQASTYDVSMPSKVSEAIKSIVLNEDIPEIPYELGANLPQGKPIQSTVIPVPTPIPGAYTKIILKAWS